MKLLIVLSVVSLAFGQPPEQQPLSHPQAVREMGEPAPAADVESQAEPNARTQPQQPQRPPQQVSKYQVLLISSSISNFLFL